MSNAIQPPTDNYDVVTRAIENHGFDGRRHSGTEPSAFWCKYLQDCAAQGASPYGINRHNRRKAIALTRLDRRAAQRQGRERAQRNARRAGSANATIAATA